MAGEDGTVLRTPHSAVNMQPSDTSAGDAKLEGRPNASDPNTSHYTAPAKVAASGNRSGVLRSQAAKNVQG